MYLKLFLILVYIQNYFDSTKFRTTLRILNTIKDLENNEKTKISNENENNFIIVKNAEGEPETKAKIIIQNHIDYLPKVSVIIPIYNNAEYLTRCLDTIINQTLKEIEIICIDDGSIDNSFDILLSYAEKDKRITLIKQQNLHSGVARNAGLSVAKGKYLSFLDSDDFFELNMLELMYKKVIKKQSDIIICQCKTIDLDTGEINENIFDWSLKYDLLEKKHNFSASEISKIIFQFCEGWAWDKLFRTEFILSTEIRFQNLLNYNDNQFTYTSLCLAKSISIIKKRLVIKRHGHKKSLSANRSKEPSCFLFAFNKIKSNLQKFGLYQKFKDSFWIRLIQITITRLIQLNKESKLIVFDILKRKFNIWKYIYLYPLGSNKYRSLHYLKYHSDYPTINIAYVVNKKNFDNFLVSLTSILKNSEYENLNFIIIYDNINLFDLQKINMFQEIRSFNFQTLNISNLLSKYIPSKKAFLSYILIYNLYLLFKIDKILYLNPKSIIRKSLLPLFEIDMNNKLVAGVEDILFSKYKSNNLHLQDKIYIDDGVLLLNLKELRKLKISDITKYFIYNDNNKEFTSNKDIFNVFADTKKILLAPEFNFIEALNKKITCQYDKHYLQLYKKAKPTIINYHNININNNFLNTSSISEYLKYNNILKNFTLKQITIPIVLSTNNENAPFMYTSMISILENGFKNTYYIFYLLVNYDFSKNYENIILDLNNKYRCNIYFTYIKKGSEKIIEKIHHITLNNFYLLLISILIPNEIDKCIYLDPFICVNKDLSDLYNIDLNRYYFAGVISPFYFIDKESHFKRLNNTSKNQYIDKGVLLMNLKQIRKDNLTKKFIEFSKKNNDSYEQDFLNEEYYGKILTLPPKYNLMTKSFKQKKGILRELYKDEDISEAYKSPYIIQYNGKKKPWNSIGSYMEKYWWEMAKKTPFIKNFFNREIIYKNEIKKFWYQKKKMKLELERPRTFNEKIQWIKLYDSTPIKTRLSDKYLVRGWIIDKIGLNYLIPLLGVYDYFEEINFEKLPNKFVIKCNHGRRYNILVHDKSKLNLTDTKSKIEKWINMNYAFKNGLELQYRDIRPKILIEKYIEDDKGHLKDYKFICFSGKPYFIYLDYLNQSEHKRNLYDLNWNQLPYEINSHISTFHLTDKPKYLEKMIELASILSKDFLYVRVDLFATKEKIFFGGMTFTSGSGIDDIKSKFFERKLSLLLKIPKSAYNIDTGEYYKIMKNSPLYIPFKFLFFCLITLKVWYNLLQLMK